MSKQKFYICNQCGSIVAYVKTPSEKSDMSIFCCGEELKEIKPNTVDAASEKHIPEIKIDENIVTVTIGSVIHPMTEAHHIEWISLESQSGNQRKELKPNEKPEAVFSLVEGDKVIAAYAYCNLHGLWRKEI